MSDTTINIYGGNNQILPNATKAEQHFHGNGQSEPQSDAPSLPTLPDDYLNPDASRLIPYLNNKESLDTYLTQLQACDSATELARIIVDMLSRESKLTSDTIVKENFIKLFLPLVNFTSGRSVGNIRARINDLLTNRPKENPFKANPFK